MEKYTQVAHRSSANPSMPAESLCLSLFTTEPPFCYHFKKIVIFIVLTRVGLRNQMLYEPIVRTK